MLSTRYFIANYHFLLICKRGKAMSLKIRPQYAGIPHNYNIDTILTVSSISEKV